MKYIVIVLLTIIVTLSSGCAKKGLTVKDFEALSVEERVSIVCKSDPQVLEVNSLFSKYRGSIDDIETSIFRGYKVHTSCNQVRVKKPDYFTCGYKGITDLAECRRSGYVVDDYETQCTDMPVSIDVDLEKSKLSMLKEKYNEVNNLKIKVYDACVSKASSMSVGELFMYYDGSMR